MLKKLIADKFLRSLKHLQYGTLKVTTPDGTIHDFSGKETGVDADIHLHDWQVISNLATKGDIAFAEDYRDDKWNTNNLSNLILLALENEEALAPYIYGGSVSRFINRIANLLRSNTLKGSRRNIHAHYDIGNDFYSLWLDASMTYSSALFTEPGQPLRQAQLAKYDRILDRLEDHSGKVLEIGCGWGGFAERALETKDYDIKGITLSNEQAAYADARLSGSAKISLEDYRHQEGQYDRIVSIEMFEAVGEQYWKTYFSKLGGLFKKQGRAMLQTITIGDRYFLDYRKGSDMIRTYIFPGGMLPSPERFSKVAEESGLKLHDRFFFGKDYARTLQHWLDNFNAQELRIRDMGFDSKFIRLWRFYLESCIATFKNGRTDVMQVELRHA